LSLQDQLKATAGHPRGFDYLRLALAVGVIAWHGVPVTGGHTDLFEAGPWRPAIYFLVPSFFALSGFLVAGSLERNAIPQFLTLRAIRIFPALTVETFISALILGPLLTTVPWHEYFTSRQFFDYFLNIIGIIHFELPGVFNGLPGGNTVNGQLWTVPYELDCYFIITLLALLGVARRSAWLLGVSCIAMLLLVARHRYGLFGAVPIPRGMRPPGNMVILAFLFGASFYGLRRHIPFSRLLFFVSAISYIILVNSVHTEMIFLSVPSLVYMTVFLGLTNPPRTALIVGADYSYGMYLYGFPLQQFVAYVLPSNRIWLVNVVLGTALAFGCAYLSWTFVEMRVMNKKAKIISFVVSISDVVLGTATEFFKAWPRLAYFPPQIIVAARELWNEARRRP
jgi:peptidoglycan/LPS O-acetylase OafA/YrhL